MLISSSAYVYCNMTLTKCSVWMSDCRSGGLRCYLHGNRAPSVVPKYKYYFYKVLSKDSGFSCSHAHCHYWGFHSQRHLLPQTAALWRQWTCLGRPEEAGLSSRCVIDRIKCLVSVIEGGNSGLSSLKGTDGSIQCWEFSFSPCKYQTGAICSSWSEFNKINLWDFDLP